MPSGIIGLNIKYKVKWQWKDSLMKLNQMVEEKYTVCILKHS